MATFWLLFKKNFFFTFSPKFSVSELVAIIVRFHQWFVVDVVDIQIKL
jgi:hypothetical protein